MKQRNYFFFAAFLAGAFLAGAFLATAFLAGALTAAFLAGAFLAGAFFTAAFLAGAFLAGAFFAAFFAAICVLCCWFMLLVFPTGNLIPEEIFLIRRTVRIPLRNNRVDQMSCGKNWQQSPTKMLRFF